MKSGTMKSTDPDRTSDKQAATDAYADDGVGGGDKTASQQEASPRRLHNLENSVCQWGKKRTFEDSESREKDVRHKKTEEQSLLAPPNYTVTWTGSVRLLQEGHKPGAELCSIGMQVCHD